MNRHIVMPAVTSFRRRNDMNKLSLALVAALAACTGDDPSLGTDMAAITDGDTYSVTCVELETPAGDWSCGELATLHDPFSERAAAPTITLTEVDPATGRASTIEAACVPVSPESYDCSTATTGLILDPFQPWGPRLVIRKTTS
jgi:hypothetical protein